MEVSQRAERVDGAAEAGSSHRSVARCIRRRHGIAFIAMNASMPRRPQVRTAIKPANPARADPARQAVEHLAEARILRNPLI
jgi:hypothetical protein